MQDTACSPKQEPNHIDIHNSINNLRTVVRQLKAFKDRLNGESQPTLGESETKAQEPSFIEVLNGTAGSIRGECDQANQILEEINNMLF